jgi:hypothetical protein
VISPKFNASLNSPHLIRPKCGGMIIIIAIALFMIRVENFPIIPMTNHMHAHTDDLCTARQ